MSTFIKHQAWLAALLIYTLALVGSGHEGGHGETATSGRIWTCVDGTHFHGGYIDSDEKMMKYLSSSGKIQSIELERLSLRSRNWVRTEADKIKAVNTKPALLLVKHTETNAVAANGNERPAMADAFKAFEKSVKVRWDENVLFVESNGMPDHPMMIGITAWQQQVPVPQKYVGANAWRIPLHPKFADNPVSAKQQLFRGAIALAVNGVPIFNPIKNDGRTDTLLAGELDQFGGHCGRGDDYHYHVGPIHLEKIVGKGRPIGYALDGFPLYGYTDENGNEPKDLDAFNGRMEKDGYRYYSTKTYPYINGGMRGEVTVRDDQIDPQPRAYSPRPALPPLRGAKITGFERDDEKKMVKVIYEQNGRPGSVQYNASATNYRFTFTEPSGKVTEEDFPIREDGRRPPPRGEQRPPGGRPQNAQSQGNRSQGNRPQGNQPQESRPQNARNGQGNRSPADERMPAGNERRGGGRNTNGNGAGNKAVNAKDERPQNAFLLNSPAFTHHGALPAEFTGDGDGVSPPLKWSNVPPGTKCFALHLWHKPNASGEEVKSYWVITNIPAAVTSLEKNSREVGVIGLNDKKRNGYDPMNSKGPGVKEYHITMYALSAEPRLAADRFNRAELLEAIKDITLAESTLSYTYERKQP
jgi:hypothetical protein